MTGRADVVSMTLTTSATGVIKTMTRRNSKSEPERISEKEGVILGLLTSQVEMYGRQLVRESDGLLKAGGIYVQLERLAGKGLVTSRLAERQEGESGLPKRLFRLTAQGKSAFEAYADRSRRKAAILGFGWQT